MASAQAHFIDAFLRTAALWSSNLIPVSLAFSLMGVEQTRGNGSMRTHLVIIKANI